jgi:hypothetical protein
MMTNGMTLAEEDHVGRMLLRSSERLLHFINHEGMPQQILDNERVLLSKAASIWLALHPDNGTQDETYWAALSIVRERLNSAIFQMTEEEFEEVLNQIDADIACLPPNCTPDEAADILSRPRLTAEDGGNQDSFEALNKLGNIQFKSEKPNLTIIKRGTSGNSDTK